MARTNLLATGWDAVNGDYVDLEVPGNSGTGGRVRINSQGNVGIGTTTPSEKLEVSGNAKAAGFYIKKFTLPVDGRWYKVAEAGSQWGRVVRYDNPSGNNPAASSGELFVINDYFGLQQSHHTTLYNNNNNLRFARSGNATEAGVIWVKGSGTAPGTFYVTENQNCALFLDGTYVTSPPAGIGQVIYPQLAGDTHTFSGNLSLSGDALMNDHDIFLRPDSNHGLGWYGAGKPFAGSTAIDGPVLFGHDGGWLGSTVFGENWTLKWDPWGWVNIRGGLITPEVQVAGTSQFSGDVRLNEQTVWFRSSGEYQGLGWYGAGKTFAGMEIDGPVLFGYPHGALGTSAVGADPERIALSWDWLGNVWVSNNLSLATLTIRGGADLAEPFPVSAS